MDNWKMVLLTTFISLIVALLTSWFTSKLAFKSDIKKYLHSKRETLYFDLCNHLDKLLMEQSLVYDKAYKEILYSFKPKVKLVASKKVIDGYRQFINMYYRYNYALQEFISMNDPFNNDDAYEYRTNEFGEEMEICHVNEHDIESYEANLNSFKNDNVPRIDEISTLINDIADAMRKDLGNSKIRW